MDRPIKRAGPPAALDEMLKECFDVRGPVFNLYGELTPGGSEAYDKLFNVLGGMIMMGVITEHEHEQIVRQLDEICDETYDAVADLIRQLYASQGEDVTVVIGYYDPEEDKRNNEEDEYTGWWCVLYSVR